MSVTKLSWQNVSEAGSGLPTSGEVVIEQPRNVPRTGNAAYNPTVAVTFRITVAERTAWKLAATRLGITVTELIRLQVNKYLNQIEKDAIG